ncbi:hypothetical protein ACM66B_006915 [Microbotryomycetes sp. NB124-2]
MTTDDYEVDQSGTQSTKNDESYSSNAPSFNMYKLGGSNSPIKLDVWGERLGQMHDFFVAETNSNRILFHMTGEWKWAGMHLEVLKGKDGPLVGKIEKPKFEQSHISLSLGGWHGDFKRSWSLSNSFEFVGPDGSTYAWKNHGIGLGNAAKLFKIPRGASKGQQVGKWQVVTSGLKKQNQLVLEPEVAPMCDIILLSVLAFESYAIETYRSVPSASGRILSS